MVNLRGEEIGGNVGDVGNDLVNLRREEIGGCVGNVGNVGNDLVNLRREEIGGCAGVGNVGNVGNDFVKAAPFRIDRETVEASVIPNVVDGASHGSRYLAKALVDGGKSGKTVDALEKFGGFHDTKAAKGVGVGLDLGLKNLLKHGGTQMVAKRKKPKLQLLVLPSM